MISILSGLFTYIGIIFLYIKLDTTKINKFLTFMLSFSLVIMIFISIFDLLPNSLIYIINRFKLNSILIILFLFVLSKLIINILNKYETQKGSLYKVGVLSLIVLFLHNIPEGIITFLSSTKNSRIGLKIAFSIAMHNIPEGICIALPFYYSTHSKGKSRVALLIGSLAEGIGGGICYLFLYKYITNTILNLIFILVGFLMISLAIDKIFVEVKSYNENKFIALGFFSGIVFFILTNIFL